MVLVAISASGSDDLAQGGVSGGIYEAIMPGGPVGGLVTLARRVLPWIIAVGILAILVRRSGGEALRAALADADHGLLLCVTVACTAGMYVLDVLSLSRVIAWFNRPAPWRQIARVKAAAYLINIVNYNAGSGAIAVWLNRWRGVPFLEGASSVFFVNVVDALVLVAFMAAGLPVLDARLRSGIGAVVAAVALALVVHLLYWRRGIDFLLLGRLRTLPIFKSFREAESAHYVELAAIRVPFDLFFVLNYWLGLYAFGIEVPFLKVLVFVPVITFISIVPVTVAGLGTAQAATVFLFAPYASEARILAFSLVMTVALNGVRALLGLPVFRRVSQETIGGL